jgi:hypothetical protein
MSQSPPQKPSATPKFQGAQSKAEKDRLAKALRQNLLRRKAAPVSSKNS